MTDEPDSTEFSLLSLILCCCLSHFYHFPVTDTELYLGEEKHSNFGINKKQMMVLSGHFRSLRGYNPTIRETRV